MIVQFPPPYTDELLYSWLARYYAKSGCMAYALAAEDLFANKHSKPNIEFITELTSAALQAIERYVPRAVLIENHTMYPCYARFLDKDRRCAAFDALLRMDREYTNLICFPKSKEGAIRYLKYCPMCTDEDRNLQGETYWHRSHQLPGITVCAKHGYRLCETPIPINSKGSPSLIAAEETIDTHYVSLLEASSIEIEVAQYVTSVFQQPIDMESDILVGAFLHSKLEGTKYLSQRGEQRNMALLYDDYQRLYCGFPVGGGLQMWQLQKIFNGKRHNALEICLIARMLGISPKDLSCMDLPLWSQSQFFDSQVKELHNQGMNYRQIANHMNASYDVVKAIGEGLYGAYHYYKQVPQKGGAKKIDWATLDKETLPKVKKILHDLQGSPCDKPQQISLGRVEGILGWPKKRLRQCPLCAAEVEKYMLSQEDYWRRLVEWAANKLLSEGKSVNITGLMRLTNMRKRDFERIGFDFTNINRLL